MGSDKDFSRAQRALIDPLVEPDPSDETGLNSRFESTFSPRQTPPSPPRSAGSMNSPSVHIRSQGTGGTVDTNPFRRSRASSAAKTPTVQSGEMNRRRYDYPSPPSSASPRRDRLPEYRKEVSRPMGERHSRPSSQPPSPNTSKRETGRTRGGSLGERYPGDTSHRPLDTIRKDTKAAHRAHHLRKKNFQGADVIDRLDKTGSSYHHEGPYDAANISRNLNWKHSPIAAVADSNEEALRATPRENIIDAVTRHRPLEGTATVPSGVPDKFGRVYNYKEGTDLMREPGADYKRWPGVQYHPDDLKGKGEPYFTIDRALKEHKLYGDSGSELRTHRRNVSMGAADLPVEGFNETANLGRSNTTGKSVSSTLKKRFGSLGRRKVET